jgi:hypothetical protein
MDRFTVMGARSLFLKSKFQSPEPAKSNSEDHQIFSVGSNK